jgi:hypothetical protein
MQSDPSYNYQRVKAAIKQMQEDKSSEYITTSHDHPTRITCDEVDETKEMTCVKDLQDHAI